MNTQRLCILVICICIITPLGLGFMLPQTTDQTWEYSTGTTSTISSSIRNSTSEYSGDFYGDLNNAIWGNIPGNSAEIIYTTTSTATSTPAYAISSDAWTYSYIDTGLGYFTSRDIWSMTSSTGSLKIECLTSDGATLISTITGVYYAEYFATGHILLYNNVFGTADNTRLYIQEGYRYIVSVTDSSTPIYASFANSEVLYRDLSDGVRFYTVSAPETSYWQNGYRNYSTVINLDMDADSEIIIGGVKLARDSDGMVSAAHGSDTVYVGDYDCIMMEIHADNVLIHGLTDGDINTTPWSRVVNTRTLTMTTSTPYQYIPITLTDTYDSGTYKVAAYVYSSEIVIGTYSSTIDYTLNMTSYFPTMDGYAIRLFNGSTVATGATLTVAGVEFTVGSGGTITYDNVQYNLTGMIISAVDANGDFYVHINNKAIEEADSDQWTTIILGGDWASIGVSVSEVSGNLRDRYSWEAGFFALTMHEYAGIGLLAAAGSFILCALMGRRSGEKVFWLLVVSGCCAAVYAVLLLT